MASQRVDRPSSNPNSTLVAACLFLAHLLLSPSAAANILRRCLLRWHLKLKSSSHRQLHPDIVWRLERSVEDFVGDVVHMALVEDSHCGPAPYGSCVYLRDWWTVLGCCRQLAPFWKCSSKYSGSDVLTLHFAFGKRFACACGSGMCGSLQT